MSSKIADIYRKAAKGEITFEEAEALCKRTRKLTGVRTKIPAHYVAAYEAFQGSGDWRAFANVIGKSTAHAQNVAGQIFRQKHEKLA